MHIDVVQLNIVIALGAVAFAARVADRERRPQGSSPTRVSLVRLLAAARRRHELQSTTRSRSISITCLVALVLVMAAGVTVGCARSPGVPSGAAGTDGTVRSQHLTGDPTLSHDSANEADYDPWQSFQERMFSFNEDRDHAWTRKSPAVHAQPQTAFSGNRESHT
jgi:hypothetical protein